MEIIKNRVTIKKYSNGFIIEVIDKNWVKTGSYEIPCIIHYNGLDYQLNKDFIICFKNENQETIKGQQMINMLPRLLEYGELSPREIKQINKL